MIASTSAALGLRWLNLAFGLAWIVFLLVWVAVMGFTKPQSRTIPTFKRVFQSLVLIAGFWLIFDPRLRIAWLDTSLWHLTTSVAIAGIVVTWAGVLFAIWARFTLGSNWSARPMVKVNHELVVKGPYRLARHPIYTGLLFAGLGSAILADRTIVIPGMILVLVGLMMKIAQEERLMVETFPSAYPEYRGHVKALIPFLL
ncbi:MAG: isoprenylcysteine carboxylmethyltransferase family protein [Acidobacteriota bacterium]|nr:isoprenylcysteine carboxylmethyltransferase family protein [Acidobacteriota bacterium]